MSTKYLLNILYSIAYVCGGTIWGQWIRAQWIKLNNEDAIGFKLPNPSNIGITRVSPQLIFHMGHKTYFIVLR